jgi:phosphoribosylanthranilate isomerase
MSVWIKICGNTLLGDAQSAAGAGADAVGFVFAPSPRRVSPEQVAAMVPQLPSTLEKIGVFVDDSFDQIRSIVEACGLTGVQLHFDAPPELPVKLRAHFGPGIRILRVAHFDGGRESATVDPDSTPGVDAVLIDSRTTNGVGGTGVAFDWSAAGKALFQNPQVRQRLIAAGGLTVDNVALAITMLQPWGVDVVTGVESSPGRKDPDKLRAFIANARAAQPSQA